MQTPKRPHLDRLLKAVSEMPALPTAVVHPVGKSSLLGAVEAAKENLITPILIGPPKRIQAAAKEAKLDIDSYELVATEHSHDSAKLAVSMAREGKASAIMKGKICLLYTSPSPRDATLSRMPSSA